MFTVVRGRSGWRQQFLVGAFLCVGAVFAQASDAQVVAIRVNAAGPEYIDSAHNVWSADFGFNTDSDALNWSLPANGGLTTSSIRGTSDPTLFLTERYGPNLTYTFAVPNGTYRVNLYFADNYVNSTFPNGGIGYRLISMAANGTEIFSNLDVFATVGAHAALMKTAIVTVKNKQLVLSSLPSKTAPLDTGFFINAIEVISQACDDWDDCARWCDAHSGDHDGSGGWDHDGDWDHDGSGGWDHDGDWDHDFDGHSH